MRSKNLRLIPPFLAATRTKLRCWRGESGDRSAVLREAALGPRSAAERAPHQSRPMRRPSRAKADRAWGPRGAVSRRERRVLKQERAGILPVGIGPERQL